METNQPASQPDEPHGITDSTGTNLQIRLKQPVTTRTQALFLQAVGAIYNSDPQTLRTVLAQVKKVASFDDAYSWYRKDGPEHQYNPCLSEASISRGDTACLQALLDYGLPTYTGYSHYPEDQSMLMYAMACNQYECFQLIIDQGIPDKYIDFVTFDYWGATKGEKDPRFFQGLEQLEEQKRQYLAQLQSERYATQEANRKARVQARKAARKARFKQWFSIFH